MTSTPDVLERVVLKVACPSCGDSYGVPLRQVAASQELLHESERMWDEGCPNYCREPACEPLAYASLVDESTTRDVVHAITNAVERLEHVGVQVDVACPQG